jgi:ankyrin repeat protein
MAAANDHVDVVRLLLNHKADVNALADKLGTAPMYSAARSGHVDVVAALLETGKCDVELASSSGWNPTICAAEQGHLRVLEMLLDYGADVNFQHKVRDYIAHIQGASAFTRLSFSFLHAPRSHTLSAPCRKTG